MSKQVEIENLDRVIKNGEIRINTVKINIDSLSREIDTLGLLEEQLLENLKCLKKRNIIAIATEFRKAKEDLEKTRKRSIELRNDRENFKKASDNVAQEMKKAREEIDKIKKAGESNVVHAKFGRKNNGQG